MNTVSAVFVTSCSEPANRRLRLRSVAGHAQGNPQCGVVPRRLQVPARQPDRSRSNASSSATRASAARRPLGLLVVAAQSVACGQVPGSATRARARPAAPGPGSRCAASTCRRAPSTPVHGRSPTVSTVPPRAALRQVLSGRVVPAVLAHAEPGVHRPLPPEGRPATRARRGQPQGTKAGRPPLFPQFCSWAVRASRRRRPRRRPARSTPADCLPRNRSAGRRKTYTSRRSLKWRVSAPTAYMMALRWASFSAIGLPSELG